MVRFGICHEGQSNFANICKKGVLIEKDGAYVFVKDYFFASPSTVVALCWEEIPMDGQREKAKKENF